MGNYSSSYHAVIKDTSAVRSKNISLILYHWRNRKTKIQTCLCALFIFSPSKSHCPLGVGQKGRMEPARVRSWIGSLCPSPRLHGPWSRAQEDHKGTSVPAHAASSLIGSTTETWSLKKKNVFKIIFSYKSPATYSWDLITITALYPNCKQTAGS